MCSEWHDMPSSSEIAGEEGEDCPVRPNALTTSVRGCIPALSKSKAPRWTLCGSSSGRTGEVDPTTAGWASTADVPAPVRPLKILENILDSGVRKLFRLLSFFRLGLGLMRASRAAAAKEGSTVSTSGRGTDRWRGRMREERLRSEESEMVL